MEQVFIEDISVLRSIQLLPNDQSPTSCWDYTTLLHEWHGIGQVMSGAWFPLDINLGTEAKRSNLSFNRLVNRFPHSLRVPQVLFLQTSSGLLCVLL